MEGKSMGKYEEQPARETEHKVERTTERDGNVRERHTHAHIHNHMEKVYVSAK